MTKFVGFLAVIIVLVGSFVWANNNYKITNKVDESFRSWFGDYVDCAICQELMDAEAQKCPNCLEWVDKE